MSHFAVNDQYGSFGSFGNLWPHIGHQNVTGPPGALLFDRDQRSYNCCFVQVAALSIYCTDFMPQLLSQVKYPMQFMVYENTYVTALSEETSLH